LSATGGARPEVRFVRQKKARIAPMSASRGHVHATDKREEYKGQSHPRRQDKLNEKLGHLLKRK